MSQAQPTDEQLLTLGLLLDRYLGSGHYVSWGDYGTAEKPARRLNLDGEIAITKDESDLLESLGYDDFWGNAHE